MDEETNPTSRRDILRLMDTFIDQIQAIRRISVGMSVSALVLAPLAIALFIYLLVHPSFFAVLEIENEFGLVLSILLGAVVIISVVWFLTGIRQYRSMSLWKGRYKEYVKEKEELDRKIASRFGLDQEEHAKPDSCRLFIVLPARKHLLIRFQNCPAKPYSVRSSAVYRHRPFANHLFGPPYQLVCLKILKYGLVFFQVEAAKAYKGSLVQLAVFNKLQNYVLNDVYPVPVRTWRTRQLLCKSESSSI